MKPERLRETPMTGMEVTGDVIVARLRRAADEAAVALGLESYGVEDVGPLPPNVWTRLAGVASELDLLISFAAPEYPWTPIERTGPILLETSRGKLRCWPPGSDVSGSRAGWGEGGNQDGDTREGRPERPEGNGKR